MKIGDIDIDEFVKNMITARGNWKSKISHEVTDHPLKVFYVFIPNPDIILFTSSFGFEFKFRDTTFIKCSSKAGRLTVTYVNEELFTEMLLVL